MAKEEGPPLDKSPMEGEGQLLWEQAVLVPLLFCASALLVVGVLALVCGTAP